MEKPKIVSEYEVIIIGSGGSGLSCANELAKKGFPTNKILILTENLLGSTSYNAGSDKQTYYRLSLVGSEQESPTLMAQSLMKGGAMHGDIALIEATCSVERFFNLVHLGVPFPHNKYGSFVGYKTDNDPLSRGTSIGPYTSKIMVEKLLKQVRNHQIPIQNHIYALEIIKTQSNQYLGVIAFDFSDLKMEESISIDEISNRIVLFRSSYLVIATGGPANIYLNQVYPPKHKGSSGLGIKAGLWLQNLTESQFGIASIQFRWNLSGSYQQVIPRYLSFPSNEKSNSNVNIHNGTEFLIDYFPSFTELSKAIFLKGYQWPFNPKRTLEFGSSLIDLAVYIETILKGNRVFIDYTHNPQNYDPNEFDPEVYNYLSKSQALQKTPILRLQAMNSKSYNLFKQANINLEKDFLEIAICAQHSNGGISGDIWWETSMKHVFAIGEVNGSHGVHRPGGSALNSGQVGALRTAEKINHDYHVKGVKMNPSHRESEKKSIIMNEAYNLKMDCLKKQIFSKGSSNKPINSYLIEIQKKMMKYGAFLRPINNFNILIKDSIRELKKIYSTYYQINTVRDILDYFQLLDACLTYTTFFNAIGDYVKIGGGSRGSALVYKLLTKSNHRIKNATRYNENDSIDVFKENSFISTISMVSENQMLKSKIQRIRYDSMLLKDKNPFLIEWIPCKPIPEQDTWFERVWKTFDNRSFF